MHRYLNIIFFKKRFYLKDKKNKRISDISTDSSGTFINCKSTTTNTTSDLQHCTTMLNILMEELHSYIQQINNHHDDNDRRSLYTNNTNYNEYLYECEDNIIMKYY